MTKKKQAIPLALLVCCVAMLGSVWASDTNNANVTLDYSNVAPQVIYFARTYPTGAITPIEAGVNYVKYEIHALDSNGNGDLSSVVAFMKTTNNLFHVQCSVVDEGVLNSTTKNYTATCAVAWYWNEDVDPNAEANATATDASLATGNSFLSGTNAWSTNKLEAFTISHSVVTFGSLVQGQTNKAATNNPMVLNNTGNIDFTTNINVKGYNLVSGSNTFAVGNVTVGSSSGCAGPAMVHNTDVDIGLNGPFASITDAESPANIGFCIPTVPLVPLGSYASPTYWVITATP